MQRIDLFGFYRLGQYVHPATELRKPPLTISKITSSDMFLRLLIEPPYEPMLLRLSAAAASDVIESHNDLASRYSSHILGSAPPGSKPDIFFNTAMERAEQSVLSFETVLEKELLTVPAFCLSPKGAYDIGVLLEHAEAAISASVLEFLPEHAVLDFREAGKCLALEAPTAAGFHVTRAVEAVLRHWHDSLVKNTVGGDDGDAGKPGPSAQRWARLEQDLIKNGATRSTVGILTQIRELHRNPIMHPEVFLTIEEALGLFDISKSAIDAMGRELAKLKQ